MRRGDDRISVDRLDRARLSDLAALAAERGRQRGPSGHEFRGWAVVTVEEAASNGRCVEATPTPTNPFHADICLNLSAGLAEEERREEQKLHANDLARRAQWSNAPETPAQETAAPGSAPNR